ncbi:MAG: anthranilate phosphoribosyltransferase, partial [Synechococcaceae bacterium WB8_1A_041]|nr:anthranilate phosphoribosyltransferase [Synechococcaceae bacterium WB8_1A_041]
MQVVQQLPALLERLLQGECLAEEEAAGLMQAWLENSLSAAQTGAFLAALRCRPPSAIELSAMALVLRAAAPLPCRRPDGPLLDSC